MNFSKRERNLLAVFGILLIAFVYVNYFLLPQLKTIEEMKSSINESAETLSINQAYEKKVEGMDSQIKILSQKIRDLRVEFPAFLNYDEIIILLRNLAENSELDIQSVSFTEPVVVAEESEEEVKNDLKTVSEIQDEKLKKTLKDLGLEDEITEESSKDTSISNGQGFVMSLNINAESTNSQLKSFLNSIKKLKNKVGVSKITINNSNSGLLSISFTLDFYGIMDKSVEESSILDSDSWKPLDSADKDNIFTPYEGFLGTVIQNVEENDTASHKAPEIDVDAALKELNTYNFSMSVVPYGNNMAPPTVSMALKGMVKTADTPSIPVIYGDSKGIEKVEIYVEEKDGKFYCKFKTDQEAFPDSAYKQTVEFTPRDGEIKLWIDSTVRKYEDDIAGVSVNIINKTSKTMKVKVVNDDKDKPRVSFKEISDNVKVSYE